MRKHTIHLSFAKSDILIVSRWSLHGPRKSGGYSPILAIGLFVFFSGDRFSFFIDSFLFNLLFNYYKNLNYNQEP